MTARTMDCHVAIAPRNDSTDYGLLVTTAPRNDNTEYRLLVTTAPRNDDIEVLNSYTTTYNNKKGEEYPRLLFLI
ncbi:MAG: hypothetical protein J6K16_04690 [Alphaproteobacteria bacterium]|nr:hypothetical protein [Alphaproteobacteria bacterium]